VSLDWSVAKNEWAAHGLHNGTSEFLSRPRARGRDSRSPASDRSIAHRRQKSTDANAPPARPPCYSAPVEATSIEGCRRIKANNPKGKCFIYHNQELALESMESQRLVMYDPSKAYLFLQYTDGAGNKNGTIYNERQEPGDQFFWDYRVPDTASYYISSVLATINSSVVDGTFTDDVTGLPAEHGAAPGNMKLSAAEVTSIQAATQSTNGELIAQAVNMGKYVWAAFGDQDGVGGGPSKANCAAWMRQRCTAAWQTRATTQQIDASNINQSIASFLIVRPPIAFLGNGWESDQRSWRSEFLWDVGAPAPAGAICAESPANVFSRSWTYGSVTLDCNTWTATVPTSSG
jgi:hypothetical protein